MEKNNISNIKLKICKSNNKVQSCNIKMKTIVNFLDQKIIKK